MLYVVLLLVLAALGLLVPALTTAQTFWAWSSVGASGAAAVVLVLDWWLRRRSGPGAAGATGVDHQVSGGGRRGGTEGADDPRASSGQAERSDVEPAEEDVDAADALVVADLTDEVRVLDERPRYHLADCSWLGERASLGLRVDEARRLGFTPCAVCRPDSSLAGAKRSADSTGSGEPAEPETS
ncbi:hypothetical protein ACFFSW_14945 [Saccharothrix longispora]|uniref:Uncharacterized protein n=1 Tax=Saccharothrix longispora TaxID=33920 RepID=A0ABU1PZT8_9PSEU|nr:hypothetical protein [Saccharothrix longispora]MDR6595956.1 hypothetical protein [Saccharothrix longispora]